MKNKKALKVLSYIATLLSGALVLFLILLIVVSCSNRSSETKQSNAESSLVLENKRELNSDGSLDLRRMNELNFYYTQFNDTAYASLDTSSMPLYIKYSVSSDSYIYSPANNLTNFRINNFTITLDTNTVNNIKSFLIFSIRFNYYNHLTNSNNDIYLYNRATGHCNYSSDLDLGEYALFYLTGVSVSDSSLGALSSQVDDYYQNKLEENFDSIFPIMPYYNQFQFNEYFNFNVGSSNNPSYSVLITGMNGETITNYSIDLPYFVSNGHIYNRISFLYWNANNISYEYNNEIYTNTNNDFGYYEELVYSNTDISVSEHYVNYRGWVTGDVNGSTSQYINMSTYWKNGYFKNLKFLAPLSVDQKNTLSDINETDFSIQYDTDVGLGNVFTLLSQAFGSMIPILAIEVIPGITIGLLAFLPLIAGIIVFLLWLIKR